MNPDSNEVYKFIFESSLEAILLTSHDGSILAANPASEELFGYSGEELRQLGISAISDMEDPKLSIFLEERRRKGKAKGELTFIRKNGEKFPGLASSHIFRDENGNERTSMTIMDISQTKKSEKAVEESETYYKAIFEHTGTANLIIEDDTTISLANAEFEKISGYTRKEIEGKKSWTDFAVKDYLERMMEYHRLRRTDPVSAPTFYESRLIDRQGNIKDVYITAAIIPGTKKSVASFLDITERKQAEDLLKKVMDVAPYGAHHYELHPDGQLIFTGSNKSADLMLGVDCGQFMGKTIEKAFPKLSETEIPDAYKRVAAQGGTYEAEQVEYDEQEIVGIYEVHAINTGKNKMTVFFRDVTEARKAENQLKSSLKEKDMLLTEIHHRVKNNMQIISSLLSLQKNYVEGKESLDILQESQNRVKSMAMIHENLYKSKTLTHIDIDDYVQSLVSDLFHSYILKERINVIVKIDNIQLNLETAIPCGLIVSEIVSNSLKYAFVDIKQGEIKVSLKKQDPGYKLIISDNGVGLPEDIDFKNTESMGLRLVNILTDQLEGEIELDRTHGTKFTITFKELEYENRV